MFNISQSSTCPLKLKKEDRLIKNLIEKKHLLQNNDSSHSKYKTALIIEGGVMFGVYGAGVAIGLEKLGLSEVFDYIIGLSAGAATGAYFLSKQTELGTSIFYEELINKEFINFMRLTNVENIDYIDKVMTIKKPLNVEKVRNSRSELLIGVTNAHTGKGELLSSKDPSLDIITAIKASSALPGLSDKLVTINGKLYCDGAWGFPYSIEYAIRELQSTDVLVITNRDCRCRVETPTPGIIETSLANLFLSKYNSNLRKAFIHRQQHYVHDMDILWKEERLEKVNLRLMCRSKFPIHRFSKNAKKIKQISVEAFKQTLELFNNKEQ